MTKRKKVFVGAAATVAVLLVLDIAVLKFQGPRIAPGHGSEPASTVRTINTAEVTYATHYAKIGYAPNLSLLGPAGSGNCDSTSRRACLLDSVTACPEGIGLAWCVKGNYRYSIQSSSAEPPFEDYWTTATPVRKDPKLSQRNYCSGPDAIVRSEEGPPLSRPFTLTECFALKPLV
jgi:hypothetical protein